MPSDVSVSRQEIADLARDPHTTDEKFWFTLGALWVKCAESPAVVENRNPIDAGDVLGYIEEFIDKHMPDVPKPAGVDSVTSVSNIIKGDKQLLNDALTVTANYHHTRGKITSLVGFLISVLRNTEPYSIQQQAQVIRQKWENADETPAGSVDTQAEQKAEEYAEKKQASKTIDLSARLKQKQKEKAARLGLVDDDDDEAE